MVSAGMSDKQREATYFCLQLLAHMYSRAPPTDLRSFEETVPSSDMGIALEVDMAALMWPKPGEERNCLEEYYRRREHYRHAMASKSNSKLGCSFKLAYLSSLLQIYFHWPYHPPHISICECDEDTLTLEYEAERSNDLPLESLSAR